MSKTTASDLQDLLRDVMLHIESEPYRSQKRTAARDNLHRRLSAIEEELAQSHKLYLVSATDANGDNQDQFVVAFDEATALAKWKAEIEADIDGDPVVFLVPAIPYDATARVMTWHNEVKVVSE